MINKDTIEYVANLARIGLADEEKRLFASQLSDILSYIEKLNNLDTKNVLPMSHPLASLNIFRKDEIKQSLPIQEALKNSSDNKNDFFRVPKIIE